MHATVSEFLHPTPNIAAKRCRARLADPRMPRLHCALTGEILPVKMRTHYATRSARGKKGDTQVYIRTLIISGLSAVAAGQLHAQEPPPPNTNRAIDATVGNDVLQLRYLTDGPMTGLKSNLDYGALLSVNREFVGSAAWMFDTDLNLLPRLRFQVGPQAYVALLSGQQKTDVFAAALGANVRYEIIRRIGLAAFGSAFYSPDVLTFGSAHNLYDFTAGAEARFAPRLTALAGYRWLKFTLVNEPDEKVANELFAGLRWRLN